MSQLRRPIAVVGLSCRFPDAEDPAAFWRALRGGRDLVTEIPADRWDLGEVHDPDGARPGTISTRFGAFLSSVDGIDWRALRVAPRAARFMDPQVRLLLELAWEALEDAGLPFERVAGTRTGVYVGIKWNDYARLQTARPEGIDSFTIQSGDLSLAANRISYQFDLVGPSLAVDVGCASSLVAVHLACVGIASGETELAIAGGANLMLALDSFVMASRASLLSPDGRCKMFDAAADGYVRAEGGGLVVLKPLDHALRDGDRIWGVIRGSAAMHNGRTEWIMASSPESQERLMREALATSGVDPSEVGYVELHGTGTSKGDPIEARAVGAVYGRAARDRPLLVGSVKTNLGHAEAAAGVASLTKVLLALHAGEVPPNLHFERPNPEIPLDELRLEVPVRTTPWPGRRLAAINSLSLGGGNAHVLLEGPPPAEAREPAVEQPTLLVLSARSEAALRARAGDLARFLVAERPAVRDLVWTAAVRRTHHEERLAVSGTTIDDLARRLEGFAAGREVDGVARAAASPGLRPVFVFSGQGTTWPGMARSLAAAEPSFRASLAGWDRLVREEAGWSLLDELAREGRDWRLDRTDLAQPAIFAVQSALASLWRSWGVEPAAVVGHSVGEVAAAHLAGVLTAEDAVRVVCRRGALMQRVAGRGRMVQVSAPLEEVEGRLPRFGGRVEIGGHNGPQELVLSGEPDAVDAIAAELREAGLTARALPVDYAFHSRQLEPLMDELVAGLGDVRVGPPSMPLCSTLTGDAFREGDFTADYWARQMRGRVELVRAMDRLVGDGHGVFLEIGPAAVLGESLKQVLRARGREGTVVASGRRERDERPVLLASAGVLHTRGVELRFEQVLGVSGRPIPLPTYPWQRDRLWFDRAPGAERAPTVVAAERTSARAIDPAEHPLLGRHTVLASPAGAHVWDAVLDPRELPWLDDHAVAGVPILPAAAYIEAVSAAVAQAFGWTACRLSDVEFVRALSVRGPTPVQLVLAPAAGDAFDFDLYARDEPAGPWTRRCRGRVGAQEPSAAAFDPAAVSAGLDEELDQAACYEQLARSGDHFGPTFQGIARAWRRDGEVLTRVEAPDSLAGELARYRGHPALLDACMHSLPLVSQVRGERGCVPTRMGEVQVFSPARAPLWSRVRRHDDPAARGSGHDRADIEVIDREGRPVLVARDVLLRWLDAGLPEAAADSPRCYEIVFREQAPPERPRPRPARSWLVVADRVGIADPLARALRARGERASVVEQGAPGAPVELPASGAFSVVHLGALDAGVGLAATDALEVDLVRACGAAVDLVGQLARRDQPGSALWLVTRGARSVGAEPELASPVQAAVWGIGRSAAQELPAQWGGLVDLDPAAAPERAAEELARYLTEQASGDDVALRGGKLHAARLVPAAIPVGREVAMDPDGAYLVTGGLGGLGHVTAGALVRRGARHLILMGRSPLPPRAEWDSLDRSSRAARHVRQVRELEAAGADVVIAPVDVARRDDLAAWLEAHRRGGGPRIRGVVHCAGQAVVEPLTRSTPGALREVLAGKALGAAWLHELLADDPLDFFVLYSSAASVLDSPMLGSYAAANAFLDALAHMRRHQGRPAITINWGAWSEVGLIARAGEHGPRAGHGVELIAPEAGARLFERILAAGVTQVAVLPIEWQAWRAAHPTAAAAPLLSEVMAGARAAEPATVAPASAARSATPRTWKDEVRHMAPAQRVAAVIDMVRAEVASALFLDGPDAVELERPLKELGFDSLMATELSAAMGKRLGEHLPAMTAFDHPTPQALADHLLTRIGEAEPAGRGDSGLGAGTAEPAVQAAAPQITGPQAPAPQVGEARLGGLSFGQERLYFLDRLRPPSTQYVEYFAIEVSDDLDVDRLRRSLAVLVRRHEGLRTTFPQVAMYPDRAEVPRALIAPDGLLPLDIVDLRGEADPLEAAAAAAHDVLGRPFDLARGPLWRGLALVREGGRSTLWFAAHHIVTDAVSIGLFAEELARVYRAGGDGAELPPLSSRYADFVRRERDRAQDERHRSHLAWWREHLAGLPPLELPRTAGRPSDAAGDEDRPGGTVSVRLSPELTARIREFARGAGCTPFELFLAAWACTLRRYSGQADLAVGAMVAHDRGELDRVLGFFVNTVALRCDLSGNPPFRDLIRRMAGVVRSAVEHRDVDFGHVVRALREAGEAAGPLIQATLNYVSPFPALGGGQARGWSWADGSWLPVDRPAKFELSLELLDAGERLEGKLEYSLDLFDEGGAAGIARHFETLLEAAIRMPERPIDELPILSPDEREQLLVGWNDTAAPFPEGCLHELFAEQAARTPDAIAVEGDGARMTYRQLEASANQLAHHLASLGVSAESRVAVCMRRSPSMVVALLGVLKAGGAYVALDPAHPRERLAFMLSDSRPVVVVTDEAVAARLPEHLAARVSLDGADAAAIAACAPTAPRIPIDPAGAAYIIYTSGSTGRPKAVVGLHRGAVNFLAWLWRELPFEPGEVCAQKTSLSFVDAYVEIFAPLLQGVPLVVVPEGADRDPERMVAFLSERRVTRLVLVPSLATAMLELAGDLARSLGRLKYWLLSGEKLTDELCDRLHAALPHAVVVNTYGSSEVSANVTWHRCEAGRPVAIGRPLDNTRVYVLDGGLQPVPVGIPGELYVGGVGLARGYLAQPGLTADRFLADPVAAIGGDRVYRMGDRVRWRPDGALDYLGRVDHQIKIRGYRVELGEVEAALCSHPGVRAGAVLAREDLPGGTCLVAYVVPRQGPGPSVAELQAHLGASLPDYMVPRRFAELSELPLTASGKLDRRALVAARPPELRTAPAADRTAPREGLEQAIAQIWREVLGAPEIDARRTFFEQGGNSLLLVVLQQRIRSALDVEIAIAELFDCSTVEALAGRVGKGARMRREPPRRPARARGGRPAAPAAETMSVEELERLIDEKYLERRGDDATER